jgi:two-component system CheB/CheR fusion protein
MRSTVRSLVSRYGFALLAVGLALAARIALDPWLEQRLPFLLLCLAVVAVAWHGGLGPALLALFTGIITTAYFLLPPRYSLAESFSVPQHQILVGGIVFLGVSIGLFSERFRSARRRAEAHADEAIRHSLMLAQEVVERRRLEQELQQRNRELAAAGRRKDEFLAMLSHELRNPLAPIRHALHILQTFGSPEPRVQQAGAMIERQVEHFSRLVDDLLDVSRITRGMIHLRKQPIELAAVIDRAIEATRPLIDGNRHTLTVTRGAGTVVVLADATRLEQVFANLLNNAAKYTERGGAIDVIEERDGNEVVIRVRDTGFGITATMLPRVFDLFSQADRTLDRSQGGLGIGLTLVKMIVELHGGTVTVYSEGSGRGSEFIVRLPIHAEAPEPPPSADQPADASLPECTSPIQVLVVEDNKDTADSLAMLLQLWGHQVRTSHDGLSGLKAARNQRPAVVLLDIGLPGMDGYAVARELRQEFGSGIRLVAMTGYGQEEDRQRAFEAGFNAHLVKPADPATLQAMLANSAMTP